MKRQSSSFYSERTLVVFLLLSVSVSHAWHLHFINRVCKKLSCQFICLRAYKSTVMVDIGWVYEKCETYTLLHTHRVSSWVLGNKWLKFVCVGFRDTAGELVRGRNGLKTERKKASKHDEGGEWRENIRTEKGDKTREQRWHEVKLKWRGEAGKEGGELKDRRKVGGKTGWFYRVQVLGFACSCN